MLLRAVCTKAPGSIYTIDTRRTTAQSLAVNDGQIVYAGNSTPDAMSFACETTRVVDLNGKMVLPGLIDGHDHVSDHPEKLFWLDLTPHWIRSHASQIRDRAA